LQGSEIFVITTKVAKISTSWYNASAVLLTFQEINKKIWSLRTL
jgi:hypothetical protein